MASRVNGGADREVSSRKQRLLSPQEAATYLGLGSRWAVRRLVIAGELEVVRLAGKWRFDIEDLDSLIANRKSQAEAARVTAAPASVSGATKLSSTSTSLPLRPAAESNA